MKTERRFTSRGPVRLAAREAGDGAATGKLITGTAAVFYDGTPDTEYELWSGADERCVERIMPGAYDGVLSRPDDVRCLFNHDPSCLLGRTRSGTLRLSVDAGGLRYECDAADTTVGRDTQALLARGDVDGSSFAFVPDEVSWTESKQADGSVLVVRALLSVTAFDVGPVTYPAYESTTAGVADTNGATNGSSADLGRSAQPRLSLRAIGGVEEARRELAEHRSRLARESMPEIVPAGKVPDHVLARMRLCELQQRR